MGRHSTPTTHHGCSNITSPLFRLPTDVWLYIFILLTPSDLSSISLTCQHILRLVDEHAFKHVLSSLYPLISISIERKEKEYQRWIRQSERKRSKWWYACQHAHLLQQCWEGVVLQPGSMEIPLADLKKGVNGRGGGARRRFGMNFAIPTLVLGTELVVVGVRSELIVYDSRKMELRGRIKLNTRVGEEPKDKGKEKESDDPWLDITALQKLDGEAKKLVVGFADGTVQIVTLTGSGVERGKKEKLTVEVEYNIPNARRQEIVDVSIQRSQSREVDLIASLSKRGNLWLHHLLETGGRVETHSWKIDSEGLATPSLSSEESSESTGESGTNTPVRTIYRSVAFNNAPLQLHDSGGSGTRAWSVLLGSSTDCRKSSGSKGGEERWVAVGITSDPAVYIYPIHTGGEEEGVTEKTLYLGEPYYVASTGQRTSVYAIATAPEVSLIPSFLLFVGFYDGVIRVYDTRQMHSPSNNEEGSAMQDLNEALHQLTLNGVPRKRRVRRELNPVAVFREDFDADAIYSLSFGGPKGTKLLVGGARHAKVRVFDLGMLVGYDVPLLSAPAEGVLEGKEGEEGRGKGGDWTAFAISSTDSPVYGVKGEVGKVVGVIDRRIWWFDFHPSSTPEGEGEERGEQGKVAYFRHREGILSYSTSHIAH